MFFKGGWGSRSYFCYLGTKCNGHIHFLELISTTFSLCHLFLKISHICSPLFVKTIEEKKQQKTTFNTRLDIINYKKCIVASNGQIKSVLFILQHVKVQC